jgi:hypothetical protein
MADISKLSRLLNGVQRQVALSDNTLVVDNLKIKMGSGNDANHATFVGTLTAARTITMPDANVDLSDIALNTSSRHDAVTLNAAAPTQESASLTGQELTLNQATTSTDGVMSSEDKTKLDGIEAGATADQSASEVPFTPDGDIAASNVQAAIQEVRDDTDTKLSAKLNLSGGTMSGAIAMGSNQITGLAAGTLSGDAVNKGQLDAVSSLIQNFEWQASVKDYVTDNTAAPATEVSGDRYLLSHDGGAPHADYDGASAGDIVEFNGTSWVATTPTLGTFVSADDEPNVLYYWGGSSWSTKAFESTTASGLLEKTGFDIAITNSTAANFIVYNASGVASSVAMSGEASLSNAGAITLDNASVIGKVLTGFTSGAGTVAATDTILEAIQKLDGNIAALDSSADFTHTQADTNDWTVADNSTIAAHLDELADRTTALESQGGNESMLESGMIAGETLTAGLKAVRMGQDAETAGRLYLADNDASSTDNFYAIGVVLATGETAASATTNPVYKAGKMTATAHGLTVGKPFYLGASGALTSTAPSTANLAAVKMGMVRDANTLEIQVQVMGVS